MGLLTSNLEGYPISYNRSYNQCTLYLDQDLSTVREPPKSCVSKHIVHSGKLRILLKKWTPGEVLEGAIVAI